jgi:hypothetical protein
VTQARGTESHSEKRDDLPVVRVVLDADSFKRDIYHAPDNAKEKERKEVLGGDPDSGKYPREKPELDEPEGQKKQEQEYKNKKYEKRRKKHGLPCAASGDIRRGAGWKDRPASNVR